MNEQEFAELAAGHALHALGADDEVRYAAALAAHPEWGSPADAETAALLAEGTPAVAPPPAVRAALLAQIAQAPQDAGAAAADAGAQAADAVAQAGRQEPPREASPVAPRRWRRRLFALAASVVLIVAAGWGALAIADLVRTPAQLTALEQIEAAPDAQTASAPLAGGGTIAAHWSESLGEAVIVGEGLPEIESDQTFELWWVRDGAAISAGTFDADDGAAVAPLEGGMQPGDTIAVTVEQHGGSPTGQPTSDPIAAIATS
ncbi:anti-sigma factor [Microbacterium fluvii]|uniref:Anti-sigma factor n=1 Tax=Microbacterium fluvii TaxID=415215 RepID=A0ABW2HDW5_9MICO|nr:anti-sigma factor [Microbacterium fluvii]MCU4671733.1 anti-sigma factor [Microbacterium fluvii]